MQNVMKEKILKFLESTWTYAIAAAGVLFLLFLSKSVKSKGAASDTAVTKLKVKAEIAVENAKEAFNKGKVHGQKASEHRKKAEAALQKPTKLFDEDSEDAQEEIDEFIDNAKKDR